MTAICAPEVFVSYQIELEVRWCFTCRSRQMFSFVVRDTVEPSCWDPLRSVECAEGHHDGDCGFGRTREWE